MWACLPVTQAAHAYHLVCVFPSAWRISGAHTWPPHSAPGRGDARVNGAGPAHAFEAPCKRAYAAQISLLIKAEMSTCSLKHLVLSFCCYHSEAAVGGARGGRPSHMHTCVCFVTFLVLFKAKWSLFYCRLVERSEKLKDGDCL